MPTPVRSSLFGPSRTFGRSIDLDPNNAYSLLNRGVAYMNEYEPVRAVQDFDKAICLQPDIAESHLYRGRALLRLDDRTAAVRDFDGLSSMCQEMPDPATREGRPASRLATISGAIEDLEEALRLKPDHPLAEKERDVAASWPRAPRKRTAPGRGSAGGGPMNQGSGSDFANRLQHPSEVDVRL